MRKEAKGALSLVLAAMFYGLYGVYSRKIGLSFGVFSQNWIRNLIIVTLLAPYFFFNKKEWVKIRKEDIGWMFVWGFCSTGAIVLLFIVWNYLPIGTTNFLLYSTMIVSGYLSGRLFYKEKINVIKLLSAGLALIGLALIYFLDLSFEPSKMIYVLSALLAGALTGLFNTLSKKLSMRYSNSQLVGIDAFALFAISNLGAFLTRESIPSLKLGFSWIWVFVYALTQIGAVGLLVYGFKHLEAQIGSIIMPTEVIFATLFGFLFFGEILPLTTILGGILIASAAALPNVALLLARKN